MTNFRITFTGGANGLYTRRIKTQDGGKLVTEAVPSKDAVPYKPAEWDYVPFSAEFEFSSENASDYEAGSSVFGYWLENEDGKDTLSDMLNIYVEKEAKSYSVSYTKKFEAEVTADLAAANVLESEYEVEQWLEANGDGELDYPDDTGEMSNIEVEENSGEYVEVEWNG